MSKMQLQELQLLFRYEQEQFKKSVEENQLSNQDLKELLLSAQVEYKSLQRIYQNLYVENQILYGIANDKNEQNPNLEYPYGFFQHYLDQVNNVIQFLEDLEDQHVQTLITQYNQILNKIMDFVNNSEKKASFCQQKSSQISEQINQVQLNSNSQQLLLQNQSFIQSSLKQQHAYIQAFKQTLQTQQKYSEKIKLLIQEFKKKCDDILKQVANSLEINIRIMLTTSRI